MPPTRPGSTTGRPYGDRVLNVVPSAHPDKDWSPVLAQEAGLLAEATAPAAVDLRADWWPIGDQGFTGSCVGWAAADGVLRWHLVKAKRLEPDKPLSPRFIWMAAKESDEFRRRPTSFIDSAGTSLKAALDVARRWGAMRERDLPFEKGSMFAGTEGSAYVRASANKIAAYFNLGYDLSDWRRWLAARGPILTRLDVDETWDYATDTGGVLTSYKPETARGGHAVALVGYGSGRFIVRNSWGAGWGDGGFAYASNSYAAAAFTEAYGVAL